MCTHNNQAIIIISTFKTSTRQNQQTNRCSSKLYAASTTLSKGKRLPLATIVEVQRHFLQGYAAYKTDPRVVKFCKAK
jgi:hypothetical protein